MGATAKPKRKSLGHTLFANCVLLGCMTIARVWDATNVALPSRATQRGHLWQPVQHTGMSCRQTSKPSKIFTEKTAMNISFEVNIRGSNEN